MSNELVLRFIGGILAGAVAPALVLGLLDPSESPARASVFVFASTAAAFAFAFAATPYLTTVPFFWFRERVLHASGSDYLVGMIGLVVGLFCGSLLQAPLASLPGSLGSWLPIVASILSAYLGVISMIQHKRDVLALFGGARDSVRGRMAAGDGRVLLDTSAIIDGRIADVG